MPGSPGKRPIFRMHRISLYTGCGRVTVQEFQNWPRFPAKNLSGHCPKGSAIVGGLPTNVASPETNVAPVNEPKPVPVKVVEINTASDAAGDVGTVDTQTSPLTEVIAGLH